MSCHSMNGKGGKIGPELNAIYKKYKPHDVLLEILEPSKRVDPKYAKVEIYDDAEGKAYFGVLVKETPTEYHLMENPLGDCEPKIFAKSPDIELTRSTKSPMPEGILNTIDQSDQIWDLTAYVIAGGNPDHAAFAPLRN